MNTTAKALEDPQKQRGFGAASADCTHKPRLLTHRASIFRFLGNKEPLLMAVFLFGVKGRE